MDIEQLKLILDTAQAAGEGLVWIVIIWIGKDVLINLIGFGALFFAMWSAAKLIRMAIERVSFAAQIEAVVCDPYLTLHKDKFAKWLIARHSEKPFKPY